MNYDLIETAIRFVQHTVKDGKPNAQTLNPVDILQVGHGECGQVASVMDAVFKFCGIRSRIINITSPIDNTGHNLNQFLDHRGYWCLVDAYKFKHDILKIDGHFVTLTELAQNVDALDKLITTPGKDLIPYKQKILHGKISILKYDPINDTFHFSQSFFQGDEL